MYMQKKYKGSVILVVVFIIALLSAVVVGIAQINTEELMLTTNQVNAAQAVEAAYAGMNDAFAQLRSDSGWTAGFTDKSFNGGSYTVTVSGTLPNLTVTSTAVTSSGFTGKAVAEITVSDSSPYIIRVDKLKVNE